jgi:hypothetical protein
VMFLAKCVNYITIAYIVESGIGWLQSVAG